MAKYRPIYTKIWKDPDFQEYSKDQKLIFLYLVSNDSTTERGIYAISSKTISNETGINAGTVEALLRDGFKTVSYDSKTKHVFVHNFLKYNGGGRPDLLQKSIIKDFNMNRTHLWGLFTHIYPEHEECIPVAPEGSNPNPMSNPISNPNPKELFANGSKTVGKQFKREAREVLSYLNENTGKKFQRTDEIEARLREGGTVEECKKIIDNKSKDFHFIENPKYMSPRTLFRKSHWDDYLNFDPEKDITAKPLCKSSLLRENNRIALEEWEQE